jgi:hypothetical protein
MMIRKGEVLMVLSGTNRRKAIWLSLLLVTLLVTGCAGFEPYEPRDHREDGPERGLLSGSDGEFIFYINLPEIEAVSEESKDEIGNSENKP